MSTISKNLNLRKVSKSTIPKSHNQTVLPHGSASASPEDRTIPDCIEHYVSNMRTYHQRVSLAHDKLFPWHQLQWLSATKPESNWVQLTNPYNGWTSNPSKCPLTSTQKSILCCSVPVWLNRLLTRKIKEFCIQYQKKWAEITVLPLTCIYL